MYLDFHVGNGVFPSGDNREMADDSRTLCICAADLLPLNSQPMVTVPWWFILDPPYAVRMVSDEYVAPLLVFPLSSMFCGYISRYNLEGSMFPWAPVSRLALSNACCVQVNAHRDKHLILDCLFLLVVYVCYGNRVKND